MNTFNVKNRAVKITAIIFAVIFAFMLTVLTKNYHSAYAQTQINLADYYSFRWLDGAGNSLRDGTVYRYSYLYNNEWCDYYTTSVIQTSPNPEWEAWTLVSEVVAPCSVTEYRADGGHSVSVAFTVLKRSDYSVTYSGEYSALNAGEYVAKAKITLNNDNYKFVYDLDSAINITGRGMSVVIEADGTATVTKIWYVAHYENYFLNEKQSLENEEQAAFGVPDWTFGNFPEEGIDAPRLVHGDEVKGETRQPDGYCLNVEGIEEPVVEIVDNRIKWNTEWRETGGDIVTFTLKRDGEIICADKPRSEWSNYFTRYMPAGKYVLELSAKAVTLTEHYAWWSEIVIFGVGGKLEYSAFKSVYSFEVYPEEITVNIPNSEVYSAKLSDYPDGNFTPIFASMLKYCTFSDCLDSQTVQNEQSYWSENYDTYYDAAPTVVFNISTAYNDVYLPAEADWSGYIGAAGEYTVYYSAEMKNYSAVTNGKSDYFILSFSGSAHSGGNSQDGNEYPQPDNTAYIAVICTESVLLAALIGVTVFFAVKNRKK